MRRGDEKGGRGGEGVCYLAGDVEEVGLTASTPWYTTPLSSIVTIIDWAAPLPSALSFPVGGWGGGGGGGDTRYIVVGLHCDAV